MYSSVQPLHIVSKYALKSCKTSLLNCYCDEKVHFGYSTNKSTAVTCLNNLSTVLQVLSSITQPIKYNYNTYGNVLTS